MNLNSKKTIYTDGALWYVNACRWAEVEHVLYEESMKNLIKRMNEYIKNRTEAFDDLFPCKRPKFEQVKNWFKAFSSFITMYSRTKKLVQRHYQMISCLNGLSHFC